MKATELRLGNYIRNMYGEVIKVDLKVLKEVSKGELFGVIELTEEILIKCGFVSSGDYFVKDQVYIYNIGFMVQEFVYKYNYTSVSIDYLHELQNLYFSLTKKELEVSL